MARNGNVRATRVRIRNTDSATLFSEIVANPTANRVWTLADRTDTFQGVTAQDDRLLLHIPRTANATAITGTDTIISFGTPIKNVGSIFSAGNFTPSTTGIYRISLSGLVTNPGQDATVYTTLYQGSTVVQILSTNTGGIPAAGVSIDTSQLFQLTALTSYNIKIATTGTCSFTNNGLSIEYVSA